MATFQKARADDHVIMFLAIHHPEPFKTGDDADPKKLLILLERAAKTLKKEIAETKNRIEADEIKNSGQLTIEDESEV